MALQHPNSRFAAFTPTHTTPPYDRSSKPPAPCLLRAFSLVAASTWPKMAAAAADAAVGAVGAVAAGGAWLDSELTDAWDGACCVRYAKPKPDGLRDDDSISRWIDPANR
jgi:hypothetical protein